MGPGLLTRIADEVGTPVFVYDAAVVRARYAGLTAALADLPHRIHYSVKANGNLAVLGLLRSLGAGADIVSGGELERVRRAGFPPEQVVFSGVGKTRDELERALAAGVGLINAESAAEVALIDELAAAAGVVAPLGLRINPDVTADTHPYTRTAGRGIKFGIPLDEAVPAAQAAAACAHVRLVSVGVHIGSQISDAAPFAAAAGTLGALVRELRAAGIDTLAFADIGGGLAIAYGPEVRELPLDGFVAAVRPLVEETGLTLLVEPGRYLVGPAGTLLTRVQYRKHSGGRDIVVVDAGMNDLLRPSLYGAEHGIGVVGGTGAGAGETVDVVGPLCESGDFLGLDRALEGAVPGALLAVETVGAYGFSMSSNYNSRPRAAEVLCDGGRWAVIRQRETVEDLMRTESGVPQWRE